ncbi:S8 family peptidase [Archangium lipolyticum]|uniref:S8 family peptidase n=1 Tax=Archangium lipolyticum TaxID=2970465 RepID=UPI00214A5E8A|nr:S8 family peptidase [Archangium lipolyticum]
MTRTLMLGLGLLLAPAAHASGVKVLEPRLPTIKPTLPELDEETPVQRLVVKFQEGTRVRLRGGRMQALGTERGEHEWRRMKRYGLSDGRVMADLTTAHSVVERIPRRGQLGRLFRETELTLADHKHRAEERTGKEMADLDLYYEVPLQGGVRAREVNALVMQLNSLDSVEIAYAEPMPEPAMVDFGAVVRDPRTELPPVPTTFLYDNQQGYLNAAPLGIDARYAWTVRGGGGEGVRIVDVEGAWNDKHEDLPRFFYAGGTEFDDAGWRDHGTAVLGVMVGARNGYGVTGIAHLARIGQQGVATQTVASAITHAAVAAGKGGIVLVELQARGPRANRHCTCNTAQCNYVPMEYWQANFDAIAQATANGVHVVEAAGNGGANLDSPVYRGAFDRSVRDSGAILVGASSATTRSPMCWTNHGSRVDVHAWGEKVVTLGFGDLSASSENQWYTARFSGTSSAAPIVVGAVASLQGAANAAGLGPIPPRTLRDLLRTTGTPQAPSTKRIGSQPNLREALPQLLAR